MTAVAYFAFSSRDVVQYWVIAPMAKKTTMKPDETAPPTSSARRMGARCDSWSVALTPRKYMR